MFLHKSNFLLRVAYPRFRWRVRTQEPVIYLTFDDGPIPDVTESVLETLHQYRAKATFFCIGDNVRKHPFIYQKVVSSGNAIGNHTFNHLNGWKTEDAVYLENFAQCQQQLHNATNLMRPPYGRIKRSQAREVLKTHEIIMWDVLSGDFSPNLTPETVLKKTIQYTEPGSILLFHDSLKARRNMEFALPRVLDHFSQKGYRFELLPFTAPA
ncbi:polysaccharide deacetylase family protein [Tellurirhabdus bombi]|uniref:polysaccharide deacetylase family protein n=1 Tax=Tellurirhabdus bombi TaxID=2907205 RepID=UPI001F305E3C|nr:polysaccharide deacetylase family protein [Tellurirhabdus bombi]